MKQNYPDLYSISLFILLPLTISLLGLEESTAQLLPKNTQKKKSVPQYVPNFFHLTSNKGDNSEIVKISDKDFRLKIHPNPFKDNILIQGEFTGVKPLRISLFNQIGVMVNSVIIPDIQFESTFRTALLPAGVYFLKIETEDHKLLKTHKLVKESF